MEFTMHLFNKKPITVGANSTIIESRSLVVTYDSALEYMIGLSDKDYKILHDVAEIYRAANASAAKVLRVKNGPTTAIEPEQPLAPSSGPLDDIDNAFLDDAELNKKANTPPSAPSPAS